MLSRTKYIAEGFKEDAEKLLAEFVGNKTVEFSKFAEIWKKHYFSLVFMGRPDQVETSEFTNEAFRVSMSFLSAQSLYQNIGTVYLLYALYRNQIADPPVKIRIDLSDWKTIQKLHHDAKNQQYKTLHYVIDYLIENAFLYVANYTLKGPLIGSLPKISNDSNLFSVLASTYRSDIEEYSVQNNLQKIQDLRNEYSAIKKGLDNSVKMVLSNESKEYEYLISDLDELVNPRLRAKAAPSIGNRRSQIKHKSFLRKTFDRLGQAILEDKSESDSDDNLETSTTKKEKKRPRRTPKHERKVGRPSEKIQLSPVKEKSDNDDDDIILDIKHLLEQQRELYLPPEEEGKKSKSKPQRFYYKLSPKHASEASDPDS